MVCGREDGEGKGKGRSKDEKGGERQRKGVRRGGDVLGSGDGGREDQEVMFK